MAFLDLFKRKPAAPPAGFTYAPTQSGRQPFYTDFGDNIYASDIIVQSIRCKANEMKKLDPRHIRVTGGQQAVVSDSSIARCLRRPNAYMTTADFLEKITILLELNKNAYIYPEYYVTKGGEKYYTGLYPLKPDEVKYITDAGGRLFMYFHFASGYEVTLPVEDVIHWRKDYGVNDYFGGGRGGWNENAGLITALDRYDKLCQSISKAVEVSCTINGAMRVNTYLADEKMEAQQAEFERKLRNNESGIIFTDLKSEYVPMQRDVKLVDSDTLKFFYDTILRANGVSLAILNGDYTKAQKEAFYEHALEADIKSLGQAFSKCVFSDREMQFGNDIIFYPNAIEFMTMENKIAYMQLAVPAGAMSVNQILAFGGLPPIEGGDEIRPRGYNELDTNATIPQTSGESEQ